MHTPTLASRIGLLFLLSALFLALAVSSKPMKKLKQFDLRSAVDSGSYTQRTSRPSHSPSPSSKFGPSKTHTPRTKTVYEGSVTCLIPVATATATATHASRLQQEGGGGGGRGWNEGWGGYGNEDDRESH
ncbi:hypothetical protein BDN70DRAFT_890838 [Pholiota conissans]|uniref:Uncharacterized protein n=1 Tax=Pholiota conissans TaxID=109636 RepID=A0A9P5ZBE0_9AGAR|nr:hypothetical protein BDN70DRAFT_890838 [Pholiota conissans]